MEYVRQDKIAIKLVEKTEPSIDFFDIDQKSNGILLLINRRQKMKGIILFA